MKRIIISGLLLLIINSCSLTSNQIYTFEINERIDRYTKRLEKENYSYCFVSFWSHDKNVGYLFILSEKDELTVNIIRLLYEKKDDLIQIKNREFAKFLKNRFLSVHTDTTIDIESISNPIDPYLDLVDFYNAQNGSTKKFVFTHHDTNEFYIETIQIIKLFLLEVEIIYPRKYNKKINKIDYNTFKIPPKFNL